MKEEFYHHHLLTFECKQTKRNNQKLEMEPKNLLLLPFFLLILLSSLIEAVERIPGSRPGLRYLQGSAMGRAPKKANFFSGEFLKEKMVGAYKTTKKSLKPVASALNEVPKYMNKMSQSMADLLKLDNKGRFEALISEIDDDMRYIRKDYASFTNSWSPRMNKAIAQLNNRQANIQLDALHSLAIGYEFMRLMIDWRENLLFAYEAYKLYLETVQEDLFGPESYYAATGGDQSKALVDERFILYHRRVLSFMLFAAWTQIDEAGLESRMKLDYLFQVNQGRSSKSEIFQDIEYYSSLYTPTEEAFRRERAQIMEAVKEAGATGEDFEQVDDYFSGLREALDQDQLDGIDWEAPIEMKKFIDAIRPTIHNNARIYTREFLLELQHHIAVAMKEIYGDDDDDESE